MIDLLFKWVNKLKKEGKPLYNLLKFVYLISYNFLQPIIDIILSLLLTYFFEKESYWFWIILIIIALINIWYALCNYYKHRKRKLYRNNKLILNEINAIMTTLDNYINEDGNTGIFEYASDLVSSSLYNKLKEIIDCDIRVSVIQQFIHESKKNYVMLSRNSRLRQNCPKRQKNVKYDKNKDYYYLKILEDNSEDIIILNEKEIEKKFYYKNKNRKSNMKQYLCIPVKMETENIVFLLQLDANREDAFGKNKEEIYNFYDNYIHPYICFLRHAYNIEKKLKRKNEIKGDD